MWPIFPGLDARIMGIWSSRSGKFLNELGDAFFDCLGGWHGSWVDGGRPWTNVLWEGCAGQDRGTGTQRAVAPPVCCQKNGQGWCPETGRKVDRPGVRADHDGSATEQDRQFLEAGRGGHLGGPIGDGDDCFGSLQFSWSPGDENLETTGCQPAGQITKDVCTEDF